MKKSICLTNLLFLLACVSVNAQKVVKLWKESPPTSNEIIEPEQKNENHWITNVSSTELIISISDKEKPNGKAVLICPGGGYAGLASHHEGTLFAQWLNKQGIAAFILKYRMPNKHKEVPLDDVQEAIRYIRKNASGWNVQPDQIGIAGFSAGGHLASTASTHFSLSGVSTRPDFSILFYPVISMEQDITHQGSKNNLFGESPSLSEIYQYSNEKQVNVNTPPAIIFFSDDDTAVLPENGIRYYQALRNNDIKASLYIFPEGGHGWGLRDDFRYHQQVLDLLGSWLSDL